MYKIGLIQPKSPETFWNLSGALEFTNKKAHIPPLGVATVAALTPPEFDVEIIDESIEEIPFDNKYDIVGITGYYFHAKRMFEISAEFRKRGILTVGGGPFCSGNLEEVAPFFDVVVCGEAEKVWPEFLCDWKQGNYNKYYVENERLDLSISPSPRWDLVKMKHYTIGIVQTSRGCPYDCEFCDVVSLFGRGNRYKPIKSILNEIKTLQSMGKWEIMLADDNFIGQREYSKTILKELIAINKTWKQPIRYFTQLTLDVAKDLELLDLLKQANFYMVFIGIESPSEETLIFTDKAHNIRMEMKEAIRRIQSRGIMIFGGMIVGFDTDDSNVFKLQRDFLLETGITVASLGMLEAYKGTKLWERLEKEGRLISSPIEHDYLTTASQNFIPKSMTPEELRKGYISLLKEVYSDSHFLNRFQRLIDQIDLNAVKKESSLARYMDLRASNFEIYFNTLRLVLYFIFNRDKTTRRLFLSALRIGFKKGLICFPLTIIVLLLYKATKEFIKNNFPHNSMELRIKNQKGHHSKSAAILSI